MAVFSKNDLITAEKLNQLLSSPTLELKEGITYDLYLHNGGRIEYILDGVGDASASIAVYKMENSSWVSKASDSVKGSSAFLGGSPTTITKHGVFYVSSLGGEGRYQIKITAGYYTYYTTSAGSSSPSQSVTVSAHVSATVYAFGNAVKGDYLVLYDSATNSGNRMTGTMLTADLLNSGRVTTVSQI